MPTLLVVTRVRTPSQAGTMLGWDSRLLVEAEIRGLAAIYWPPEQVENATRVSACESGWETGAWAYIGEDSRGLWQLNVEAHPEYGTYNLFDPMINAYWAASLWREQGWGPWTCAHKLGIVRIGETTIDEPPTV
jgi:hypothetical protein